MKHARLRVLRVEISVAQASLVHSARGMLKDNNKRSFVQRAADAIRSSLLHKKFTVGERYEVYVPVAHVIEDNLGATFSDGKDYTFTLAHIYGGVLWTQDIAYAKLPDGTRPPPPHPVWGVPLPVAANEFIRPVADE